MKHFSRQVRTKYSVTTSVKPRDNGCWVTLTMQDMVSDLRGAMISIESFGVQVSLPNAWCPYIVQWSDRDLVKRQYRLQNKDVVDKGVHGFADNTLKRKGWEREADVPPILSHNVWEFALSDIQVAYMKLVALLSEHGSLSQCCPANQLKSFYADKQREVGEIQCFIAGEDEGGELMQMLQEIGSSPQLLDMYQGFSDPYLETLVRYGVDIEQGDEDMYPMLGDSFIFPLEALNKMLVFLQELENNNFVYHIPDTPSIDPIEFRVFVPKSDKLVNITADLEVLVATGGSSNICCIACEDECDELSSKHSVTQNPKIIALTEKLDLKIADMQHNFTLLQGIGAVRRKQCPNL